MRIQLFMMYGGPQVTLGLGHVKNIAAYLFNEMEIKKIILRASDPEYILTSHFLLLISHFFSQRSSQLK